MVSRLQGHAYKTQLMRCLSIRDALATQHWLRLPQRVDFKVAVVAFCVRHVLGPPYPNDPVRVADLPGRRRLPFQLTTVGRRTFPVAESLRWNSLPSDIQPSPSLYSTPVDFVIALLF